MNTAIALIDEIDAIHIYLTDIGLIRLNAHLVLRLWRTIKRNGMIGRDVYLIVHSTTLQTMEQLALR